MSAPCGTYAAAIWHRTHGEPVDDDCREAERAYQNEWRKTRAGKKGVKRESVVRNEALRRLVAAHQKEFDRLRATVRAAYDRGELS